MDVLFVLDRFLEAALHTFDLDESTGYSKEDYDSANALLSDREREFIAFIGLDTEHPTDSDKYDQILELVEAYRKNESEYKTLVDYVETIRKK